MRRFCQPVLRRKVLIPAGRNDLREHHGAHDRSGMGKIIAMILPIHAVAYHFQNDPETIPEMVTALLKRYDGPVVLVTSELSDEITRHTPAAFVQHWRNCFDRLCLVCKHRCELQHYVFAVWCTG